MARSRSGTRGRRGPRKPRKRNENVQSTVQVADPATRGAIDIPMGVLSRVLEALDVAAEVAEKGNVNSLSDAGVAALALRAAAGGALLNVLINLPGISNADYIASTREEGLNILEEVKERCHAVVMRIIGVLNESLTPGEQNG